MQTVQNSSFHHKFRVEKSERRSKKDIFLLLSSCLLFVPFPRSLISWVAPLSRPPWLSARPEQSLGILEFPLCSWSWLTYLFNYFTVCLLFKRRGPCCFFPSALLFKTSFSCRVRAARPNGCDQHLWSAMTPSKGLVLGKAAVCVYRHRQRLHHSLFL